jgi:5S rRNA maturation endonuclease (ribonuclease M5)
VTATDDFVAAVERATGRQGRRVGREIRLLCPAHDDTKPSLDVREGDDGRPLAQCRSRGCTFEAICEAVGFDPGVMSSNGSRDIRAVYDYVDETGALLFQAVRFQPKGFAQRRPDGADGWRWALDDVRRVLFRLPLVVSAIERGHTIYVAEGEKDVLALEDAGVIATCNPMGAGKWRSEYAEQLRGACSVVVIADSDEPGRKHANDVAASLTDVVADVRVVEAAIGKDVSDHLAAGKTLDDLQATASVQTEAGPFDGLTHAEVLDLEFDSEAHLVDDLVECGVVGVVAGIPETHKSWLAQAIAVGVANGEGEILGRGIRRQGSVGYFWQDDSRRNEAERIRTYARVHETPRELEIVWFLNVGLTLPDDTARLRATVEQHGFVLVVIDSFYNVATGADLKDRDGGQIVALLKNEVADPTGCTVLIVDHMPWATDANRSRLRAYGDVFKGAATRFGIYIDAERKKLFVEARGNNVRGFKRTPAYWDPDTLELRLVDIAQREEDEAARDKAVLDWLLANPGQHSTTAVRENVEGRDSAIDAALERLKTSAQVRDFGRNGGPWSGRRGAPRYWEASSQAGLTSAEETGPMSADLASRGPTETTSAARPAPFRGAEVCRADVSEASQEELEYQ